MPQESQRLSSQEVTAIYQEHARDLERFLLGVLKDAALASDCLQATFTKLVEQGHQTRAETRRSWLFTVAYQEAMLARRKAATTQRVLEKGINTKAIWRHQQETLTPEEQSLRGEAVAQTQVALTQLSEAQRQLVHMRIYEGKTFAVIAQELDIPLGTALARMQAALKRLREILQDPLR